MSNTDELTHLNFLAVLINTLANPGDISPRWLCMNETAKTMQISHAEFMFESWKRDELGAQELRRLNREQNVVQGETP